MSKRTVKDGEAMVLWTLGGKAKEVVGPARIRTWFSTIRFLDRITAGPFEFLKVARRDGVVEHLKGPVSLWINPVKHEKVTVEQSINLAAPTDAMVVYKEAGTLERFVVRGPATYCPEFGTRVHQFEWTRFADDDTDGKTMTKFESLKVDAPYLQVVKAKLATNDGGAAMVRVALALILDDIEKVVDASNDVPADLAAAFESDLVVLGRRLDSASLRNLRGIADLVEGCETTFEEESVNKTTTNGVAVIAQVVTPPYNVERALPRLCGRCFEAGLTLRGVELRGLAPSAETQAKWRAADESARAIELAAEARRGLERQAAEAKLTHDAQLCAKQRAMELDALDSQQEAKRAERHHKLQLDAAQRTLELDDQMALVDGKKRERQRQLDDDDRQRALDNLAKHNDEIVRFLAKLKHDAAVDTTNLLYKAHFAASASPDPSGPTIADALVPLLTALGINNNKTTTE